MAQIIRITSEALQSTIRRLLPSQQGFGEDLQASNVIQPIIDLTPSAEGSEIRADLQTAIAFGSQTVVDVQNATTTILNSPGFYRIFAIATARSDSASVQKVQIDMTDGFSSKALLVFKLLDGTTGDYEGSSSIDFTIFLRAGDSVSVTATANATFNGSTRQIADVNGNFVNPVGFTPQ